MVIMEDKSEEKEKTEDVLQKLFDQNLSLGRPRNFSLQRRREIFYFSDESERGILKRVPVKNGAYKINELETVSEKSDGEKTGNEIWSDVPLNSLENSKAKKINSATKSDQIYKSDFHYQNSETVLKSREKIARNISQSSGLNNVAGLGTYKINLKNKAECQDTMIANKQVQTGKNFLKPLKGAKKIQKNIFLEINSENVQGSLSDEKYKKFSASNKKSS